MAARMARAAWAASQERSRSQLSPARSVRTYGPRRPNKSPHLDGQYSAFGQVVRGLEVVDAIAMTKTSVGDRPITKQEIKSAVVIPAPAKQ